MFSPWLDVAFNTYIAMLQRSNADLRTEFRNRLLWLSVRGQVPTEHNNRGPGGTARLVLHFMLIGLTLPGHP